MSTELDELLHECRTFKIAPRRSGAGTQEEKVRVLAGLILSQLRRDGRASVARLDEEAAAAGLTGRTVLQVGAGVGGRGGLNLHRRGDAILAVADNVKICASRLGPDGAAAWLAREGLGPDEFRAWLASLPSAD